MTRDYLNPIYPRELGLHALEWPITWRYDLVGPWGMSQLWISLEVPMIKTLFKPEAVSAELGLMLWSFAIARAISVDTKMVRVSTLCWHGNLFPNVGGLIEAPGFLFGRSAPRDQTPGITLISTAGDRRTRQTIYLPGSPRAWSNKGRLTFFGWSRIQEWLRGLYWGFGGPALGSPMRWIYVKTGMYPITQADPYGAAFFPVEYARVNEDTTRAPDPSNIIWPGLLGS